MATIDDLRKITAWSWPNYLIDNSHKDYWIWRRSHPTPCLSAFFIRMNVDASEFKCIGLRNPQKAKYASVMKSIRGNFPSLKVKGNGTFVYVTFSQKDEVMLQMFFR